MKLRMEQNGALEAELPFRVILSGTHGLAQSSDVDHTQWA